MVNHVSTPDFWKAVEFSVSNSVPSRKTRIRKKLGLIHISEFRPYKDRLVCILFYIFTFCSLTSSIPLRLFIGYEIRTENLSVFFSLLIAKCLKLKLTRFRSLVPFRFRILKVVPLKSWQAASSLL